jgi:hypothetical protein
MNRRAKNFAQNSSMLIAAVLLTANAAHAAPKAYESVTENLQSNSSTHMWSDGNGKIRSESNINGVNHVSIMDLNSKVMYSISDQTKTIMKMPLKNPPGQPDPSAQWQEIGTKVIDGHPCHGKRATMNGAAIELWTGDDTNCTVLMTNNGKPVQKLKSWSATVPNASMFNLPSGYKTVDMSNMMNGMGAGGNFDPAAMRKMYGQGNQ